MLKAYVCRQCRVRAARRTTAVRSPQWQPRATFISFGGSKPREATREQQQDDTDGVRQGPRITKIPQAERREGSQGQERNRNHEVPNGSSRSHAVQHRPQYIRHTSRYAGLVDEAATQEASHTAAYPAGTAQDFNQAGMEETAPAPGLSFAGPIQAASRPESRDVLTAWALFNKTYTSRDCEALTHPPLADIPLLNDGKVFRDLLHTVTISFCRAFETQPVTPTELIFRYEQLGIARDNFWTRDLLAYLTHQVIESANTDNMQRQQQLPALLRELISAWRLFFQCKGIHEESLDAISTKWNLPTVESMPDEYGDRNFGSRLNTYHPKLTANPTLSFCAVYLYSIHDALKATDVLHQEAAPLLQFFERLLAGSHIEFVYTHTQNYAPFKSLSPDVQQQIMAEIDGAPFQAVLRMKAGPGTPGDEAANREAFFLKLIARAVESKQSSTKLEGIWEQVVFAYTPHGQTTAIPPRVYDAFLSGFMILFKSPRSVETWNHMIAHGVQPTIRTWVALLEGCVKANDFDGLNAMWQRMLASGIEPDEYAWTTRVNGLFTFTRINDGLAALDEMGRKWRAAEEASKTTPQKPSPGKTPPKSTTGSKRPNTVIKPSIEVINGALTALVKIRGDRLYHDKRLGYVQKILGWAGGFGVRPNAITYNTLIRLYLNNGDHATAFKILRQMENEGISGDAATHTMLMTVAFDKERFDNMTPSQQTTQILSHLDSIEATGVKLNDYLYHTAVDRLLKKYRNYDAVKAIVEHMTARKMVPSAAIYTSLATHYFQQNPPNVLAVDGLVNQIFTSHRVPSDTFLFDRLIEGYAYVGNVGAMMSVLTRMSKNGNLPGWHALTTVIRALAENGEYDRARNLVRDISNVKSIAQGGIMGGNTGEFIFFRTVNELDLGLNEEMMGQRADFSPIKGRVEDMVDERGAQVGPPVQQRREGYVSQLVEPGMPERKFLINTFSESDPVGNVTMPVTPRTAEPLTPTSTEPVTPPTTEPATTQTAEPAPTPEQSTPVQEKNVHIPVRTRIVEENFLQAAAPVEPAPKQAINLEDQDVYGFLTDEPEPEAEERRA